MTFLLRTFSTVDLFIFCIQILINYILIMFQVCLWKAWTISVLISVLLSAFDIGLLEHPLSFLPCLLVVYLHSETRLQT